MKKIISTVLILMLTASLFAGCGKKVEEKKQNEPSENSKQTETKKTDETKKPKKDKVVKIFQFKVEIAEQLEKMKVEYEKQHPGIKLDIETAGGGADYGAMLKSKFAADEKPDIFNNGGYGELNLWIDKLEDLSDQPWVANLIDGTSAPMTKNSKIYGQPMNTEGYGFLYNKDLFAKAGIKNPPTTLKELEESCSKLKAAGITPFSNGYQEWWVLGIHNFNTVIANQKDPDAFIKGLKEGTINLQDNEIANNWVKLLDLTVKYGQKNPLTVDYNTQVTEFAAGKTAMMQQGNWTQVQISKINPDIKVGILPMPVAPGENNKILVGVPNNWVIYKNSPVKAEAKEFLNWMVSSETGKKYIVKEFKFIPAFKNIPYKVSDLGDIAVAIGKYTSKGNVLGWHWAKLPDGAVNEIGAYMQAYISKSINKDQMLDKIEKVIKEFANK